MTDTRTTRKYVTAAQAEALRASTCGFAWFVAALPIAEQMRAAGVDYFIVPDDDPRVGTDERDSEQLTRQEDGTCTTDRDKAPH